MPAVRVLYVIDSLVAGGAERSLAAMAPHLAGAGVELHVVPLIDRAGVQADLIAGGAVLHAAVGATRRRAVGRLRRVMDDVGPDLVHTTLFEADVAGRLAARLSRRPSVTSLVGGGFPMPPGATMATRARFAGARGADLATARLAVRFHAVSESVAAEERRRLLLPPGRVEVIHRGRDLDGLGRRTDERRTRVRTGLGIDGSTPVVLVVARHDPRKGLDVLVDAWPLVTTSVPGALLLVAGRDGAATPSLQRAVAALPGPPSVRLLGHREDVGDLLAAADVLALCSRREGLPGTLLEALALEVPVVATDIAPVLDVVGRDGPARLVTVGDSGGLAAAIVAAISEPPAPDVLRTGRALVERSFSIGAVTAAMVGFYRRSLERGARS